ncbi:MAG: hypothetical protein JNM60_00150 [Candidatus Competibacteraceae bacterium]|nr:hypothetical protein [Candidatus Competibacteraceae bacterium]
MTSLLHLVVPGLLGPWPGHRADPAFPRPRAPSLEWLLARARPAAAPASTDALLFQLFGFSPSDAADGPVAAVTRLADGGALADGWWQRADPVHLRPDLHGVFLADARALAIEAAEARALAEAFNQTFADEGLQLEALRPERWYLRLPADPGLRSHPLESAIGRDIRTLLPYGPAKARWHKLLTEAQMLFHAHPVNRAREERNQPAINGLWLWGGGHCPTGLRPPAAGVYADDPLVRGLVRLAGAAVAPAPERADDWRESAAGEADGLVVLDTLRHVAADGDIGAWVERVERLETAWFSACRRWLRSGKLTALRLYPGDGQSHTVTSAARWRFWRRPRSLVRFL